MVVKDLSDEMYHMNTASVQMIQGVLEDSSLAFMGGMQVRLLGQELAWRGSGIQTPTHT